jgi:hypothetical protein
MQGEPDMKFFSHKGSRTLQIGVTSVIHTGSRKSKIKATKIPHILREFASIIPYILAGATYFG